jgi:para-nitrobenzyl esterase
VEVEHVLHQLHPLALHPLAGRLVWLAALACAGASDSAAESNGQSLPSEESSETPRGVQRNVGPSGDVEAKGLEGAPRVAIEDGALLGAVSGQVERFLGIPFAKPPVDTATEKLRFEPPVPPDRVTGERLALEHGSFCKQLDLAGRVVGDEDCLYLNVYRPANTDDGSGLPVMVWIHGGSFENGAGSDYDPQRMVEQNGVIVVTINYRLGALGFLALQGAQPITANHGLMDQQQALRWVQSNIAAFGGDPAQVTIAGQSAGGVSVCAHFASPSASGLFSRAVIQSGACASVPLGDAQAGGRLLVSALPACASQADVAQCARTLDAAALVSLDPFAFWGPVVDGTVLPQSPSGSQARVPVLVGSVSDEMRGFLFAFHPVASEPAYRAALAARLPGLDADAILLRYPVTGDDSFLSLTAAVSDSGRAGLGSCLTADLADALSASTTTFAYELDDAEFDSALTFNPVKGATHSSDLLYLFDVTFLGAPITSAPFNDAQSALADHMVSAWGAFIQTGAPSADGTEWQPYTAAQPNTVFLEPSAVRSVTDTRTQHECAFWQNPTSASAAPAAP